MNKMCEKSASGSYKYLEIKSAVLSFKYIIKESYKWLRPRGTHRVGEGMQRKCSRALKSCYMCVQALCAAVVLPDVLQTMELLFSGADVMCATGDPTCSTPYLLAQRAGQRLQMEFLHQNKLSGKQH